MGDRSVDTWLQQLADAPALIIAGIAGVILVLLMIHNVFNRSPWSD